MGTSARTTALLRRHGRPGQRRIAETLHGGEHDDGAMADCLGADTLTSVIEGRADPVTRARTEAHASRCASCRQLLSSLARSGTPPVDDALAGGWLDRVIAPGTRLDRYVVTGEIAAGGMGVVYAADDPELQRTVAIKLLHGHGDPQLQQRLRREAQVMAQLAHPNVVTVYDVGVCDGELFLAMEYVAGETLASWLTTPRPWRDIVHAFLAAGRGLAAAHAAGIVHRDFKPDNVLIGGDGRVRVGDFGLARPDPGDHAGAEACAAERTSPEAGAHRLGELTASGTLVGTPQYIAPELYSGAEADARSDQFSFCVALFTALHGTRPFDGDSFDALAASVRAGRLREPATARRIPQRIRAALRRGLAVDPERRFATMTELLAALDPGRRRWRWLGLHAALTAAVIAAIALVAGGGGEPPCSGAPQMDRIWNGPREQLVAAGLRASGPTYDATAAEVVRVLDRYAGDWRAMRVDACRAARVRREQSEDVLDLRMTCLDRRSQLLDGIAGVLSMPGPHTAERAVSEVHAMPAIADCADLAALTSPIRPPNPQIRRRVDQLRTRLSALTAERAAGRYEATLASAEALAGQARELGYRPLEAETLALVAALQERVGHAAAARTSYEQAQLAAEAGHDDRQAAAAAVELVGVVVQDLGKTAELPALRARAGALLERIDHPPVLETRLLALLGGVEIRAGDLAAADRDLHAALALGEKLHGASDLGLVRPLLDLAYLEIQRAHSERARPYLERALAIQRPLLGDQHPEVAETLEFLGGVASETEHYAEAAEIYRRVRAIYERAHGARSTAVANLLGNVARVELMQGKAADALADYRTAYEIDLHELGPLHEMTLWQQIGIATGLQDTGKRPEARGLLLHVVDDARRALGPDHQTVAMALETLGTIELQLHDHAAALAHFRESIAMYRRVLGPDYPGGLSLGGIGHALLGLGQPAPAITPLEEARRVVGDEHGSAPALVDSLLGRALIESGRDEARGRRLILHAWPVLAGDRLARDEAAELSAWMKRHGLAAPR